MTTRLLFWVCLLAFLLASPCAAQAGPPLTIVFSANTHGFFKPCPS